MFVVAIFQYDTVQYGRGGYVLSLGAQVSAGIGLLNGGKSGTRQIQNVGGKTHCTPISAPFNQNSCAGIS